MSAPMHHVLKCWPAFFEAVGSGIKTFEIRRNDRGFRQGDSLELREWDPHTEKFTGPWIFCRVTFVLSGPSFGIEEGYVVMSIQLPGNHQWPPERRSPLCHERPNCKKFK